MFESLTLCRIDDEALKAIVIGGGLIIAVIAMVSSAIHRTISVKQREQSRREIAAYVAEGSMTADDAAKLMTDEDGPGCGRKKRA